jgi:hypothetical protein
MTTETSLIPHEVWNAKIYSSGRKHPGLGTTDGDSP